MTEKKGYFTFSLNRGAISNIVKFENATFDIDDIEKLETAFSNKLQDDKYLFDAIKSKMGDNDFYSLLVFADFVGGEWRIFA